MSDRNALDTYKKGDHWVISDRDGSRIRSSDSRMEWTGAIVSKDEYEERHPQDFVRGIQDHQAVDNPRPEPVYVFGGLLETFATADAAAGDTALVVFQTTRMAPNDVLCVPLDNGDMQRVAIQSVDSLTHLTLAARLLGMVSSGAKIFDETAVAAADIG